MPLISKAFASDSIFGRDNQLITKFRSFCFRRGVHLVAEPGRLGISGKVAGRRSGWLPASGFAVVSR